MDAGERRRGRDEPAPQLVDTRRLGRTLDIGLHERRRRGDDAGDVVRAAAAVALLAAADDQRIETDSGANGEHAHALRTAELVRAQRERIDVRPQLAQIQPTRRLNRVGVEHRVRRVLSDDGRDRSQIGDRADLVVDGHHRHDRDVVSECPRATRRRRPGRARRPERPCRGGVPPRAARRGAQLPGTLPDRSCATPLPRSRRCRSRCRRS